MMEAIHCAAGHTSRNRAIASSFLFASTSTHGTRRYAGGDLCDQVGVPQPRTLSRSLYNELSHHALEPATIGATIKPTAPPWALCVLLDPTVR